MAPDLDHVQICAPPGCEDSARSFFGGLLGLEEVPKPSGLRERGGVWFRAGERQLHVGVEEDFTPAHKAHVAFAVDTPQLEALAARLEAEGAPVEWDEAIPGVRRFYSRDPWGNRIELLARP